MERPSLDSLLLTEDELQAAKRQVEEMAYRKWCDAGRPEDNEIRFWCEAELEWIEYYYVPDRNFYDEPRTRERELCHH